MIQNENESSTSIDQNEESRNEKNAKLKAERMWFLILLLSTLLPNCQQQEVAAAQMMTRSEFNALDRGFD